jgi:hypothetical protein
MKRILFSLILFAGLILFASPADASDCTQTNQVNGYNVQVTIKDTSCSVITQADWNWLWGSEAPSIIAILGGTGTYTKYGSCGNIHVYVVTNIPINGQCGSANGVAVSSAPTSGLCSRGSASSVSGTGPWTWKCNGLYGGSNANCSAPAPINGVCGSANGVPVFTAPSSNLCLAGTASAVSGSGPWSWNCNGVGGGSSSSCSAPLATVAAPANFTATALSCSNGVSLSWSSSTGATSYKIYRNSNLINTTISRTYIDNSISISGSYTYYVRASGLGGDSPDSNSATVHYLATCGDILVLCTASTTNSNGFKSPANILWTATTSASSTTGYSWVGSDGLSGSAVSTSKIYTIAGLKRATTTVTYNKYNQDSNINETVKVLVVGGGAGVGGGVSGTTYHAGGGGGQVLTNDTYSVSGISPLTMDVVVGAGGGTGGNGKSSTFGTLTALGGNKGYVTAHGGTSGAGYAGGAWTGSGTGGAGGGGASGVGLPNSGSTGGAGGPGVTSALSGTSVTYGGGGKGGQAGQNYNGAANTGKGGGGESGTGGSGVVIIRYNTADFGTVTGGTKTIIGSETIHTFTAIGTSTITFSPKSVFVGTGSATVPCPGAYVFNSSDVCISNCDNNPYIVVLPPTPVLDPNLNCSGFSTKPGATSTLNKTAIWTVSGPICPSCYSVWTINGDQDINSVATRTLRYIPTTIGTKNISVYFGSTTASTTGTYGSACNASTTVGQTGGSILEI